MITDKLDDMPGARRQRVSNQFDQLDTSTKNHFESVDGSYNPASEATDLFENTGPSGRKALNDLTDTDGEAADVLLQMDDSATQWRFARASDSGEVNGEELGTALNQYDGMDAREQDAADELVAETGDDGTVFLAKADDNTVQRVVADGGIDGYDRSISDLYDGDEVDSDTLDRVDETIAELPEKRKQRAKDLISDTDSAGVRFFDEFDAKTRNRLLDYDGESARGMRRSIVRLYNDDSLDKKEIETFSSDLADLQDSDIDGIEHVISDDIADSSTNNVRGAMYEFRVANGYVKNKNDIAEIGRTRTTVRFDDLSSDQTDQIIKEIDFADGDYPTRSDKVEAVREALNPDSLGRDSRDTELDILN